MPCLFLFMVITSSLVAAEGETVGFEEPPQDTTVAPSEAALLTCKVTATADECQWSWQPLGDPDGEPVVVKTFPSFGDEKRDCSVRFSKILLAQKGIWTCSVKLSGEQKFSISASAKLDFIEMRTVEFEDQPTEIIASINETVIFPCIPSTAVEVCEWVWHPQNKNSSADAKIVRRFEPFGSVKQNCSIRVGSVSADEVGMWLCGVTPVNENKEVWAPAIQLKLRPRTVRFTEVTQVSEVGPGRPARLACKLSEAVEECRWLWRALGSAKDDVEKVRFIPATNNSNDCSLYFEAVQVDQSGTWTCSARLPEEDYFRNAEPSSLSIHKGFKFVQLSQDIQVAMGEPVLLRCVVNTAVDDCQWTWQSPNKSGNPVVLRQFSPIGEESRDCSLRFKSALEEQEGTWFCGVRLYPNTAFTKANSPATITLLPAVKVRFLEQPEDTRAALGDPVFLRCVTTAPVVECQWTWQPLTAPNDVELGVIVKQFPAFGNHSRDCSIRLGSVLSEQEGWWACTVRGPPNFTQMSTPLAKLKVYEPVPVDFVQLSQDVQMPPGGPFQLKCLTATKVEQCRWTWQSFNSTSDSEAVVVKEFPPAGADGRDCSMRFSSVLDDKEGFWTCGARNLGEIHFSNASPAKITLLQPESMLARTEAQWLSRDQKVKMTCHLSTPHPNATCQWVHPQNVLFLSNNLTKRFFVNHNTSNSVCTITFHPEDKDLGHWKCLFKLNLTSGEWEVASSTFLLLDKSSDDKLSWLVGVLAAMVLSLTLLLVAVAVCKCKKPDQQANVGLGNANFQEKGGKKDPARYTESPTKINFQFRETPGRAITTADPPPTPVLSNQHIYERVDRYVSPTTCKSIYENVE